MAGFGHNRTEQLMLCESAHVCGDWFNQKLVPNPFLETLDAELRVTGSMLINRTMYLSDDTNARHANARSHTHTHTHLSSENRCEWRNIFWVLCILREAILETERSVGNETLARHLSTMYWQRKLSLFFSAGESGAKRHTSCEKCHISNVALNCCNYRKPWCM